MKVKEKKEADYKELIMEIKGNIERLDIPDLIHQLQLASYDPVKLKKLRPFKMQLEAVLFHTII